MLSVDYYVESDLNEIPLVNVSLRDPDGALLLAAIDTNDRGVDAAIVAPLEVRIEDSSCGEDKKDPDALRGKVSLTLDGETMVLGDGHDSLFLTDAGAFGVEVETAITGNFGEASRLLRVLVVAVQR